MVDVVTIGNSAFDVILKSNSFKVYKDARFTTGYAEAFAFGTKVEIDELYKAVGGGAVNAATTFVRQGFSCSIVSKVGDDVFGKEIIDHLKYEGVATPLLSTEPGLQTAYSTILLTNSGERTVLAYRGRAQNISQEEIVTPKLMASWFYITSLSGNIPVLEALLKHAYHSRIKVALNPGLLEVTHKDFVKLLHLVDVLIINRDEADLIFPKNKRGNKGSFQAFCGVTKAITLITDGVRGAACCDGRNIYYVPAEKIAVVDRTGAGDAFGSGFIAGLLKTNGDIDHALALAVANASSVCKHIGAVEGIMHAHRQLKPLAITQHDFV